MTETNALAGATADTSSEQTENASSPAETAQTQKTEGQEGAEPTQPESGEPSTEKTEGQSQETEGKKPKSPAAERISQLVKERNEAEIRAYAAEQEIRRLKRPIPARDGETDIQRAVREARQAENEGRLQETQEQANEAKIEARNARYTLFSEKVGDSAVVDAFCKLPRVSEELADLVAESDKAKELATWLSANPSEARRLSQLPPHRLGAELARKEGELSAKPTVRKVSQAPEPSSNLKGGSSPGRKSANEMSYAEYKAMREKQIGQR